MEVSCARSSKTAARAYEIAVGVRLHRAYYSAGSERLLGDAQPLPPTCARSPLRAFISYRLQQLQHLFCRGRELENERKSRITIGNIVHKFAFRLFGGKRFRRVVDGWG